jgi:hypothetical protein
MAIAPKPKQLQIDPARRQHRCPVATGLLIRLGSQAIGQLQAPWPQLQRPGQVLLHEGSEGVGLLRPKTHIFIKVEAAPARQQRSALLLRQGQQPFPQGGVHRLHRAPSGQPEHSSGFERVMYALSNHSSHSLRIPLNP